MCSLQSWCLTALELWKRCVFPYVYVGKQACMYACTKYVCMSARTHACMDGCMYAWMYGCMDVWMFGCMYYAWPFSVQCCWEAVPELILYEDKCWSNVYVVYCLYRQCPIESIDKPHWLHMRLCTYIYVCVCAYEDLRPCNCQMCRFAEFPSLQMACASDDQVKKKLAPSGMRSQVFKVFYFIGPWWPWQVSKITYSTCSWSIDSPASKGCLWRQPRNRGASSDHQWQCLGPLSRWASEFAQNSNGSDIPLRRILDFLSKIWSV